MTEVGGGVKKVQNMCDVIYEWPLNAPAPDATCHNKMFFDPVFQLFIILLVNWTIKYLINNMTYKSTHKLISTNIKFSCYMTFKHYINTNAIIL